MALLLAVVCTASGQAPGPDGKDGPKPEPGKKSDDKPNADLGYYPPAKALVSKGTQKSKLEEMLAAAMKDNPDVRVARAKLEKARAEAAEAEAEVNRALLQVAQKVTQLYKAVESQKETVASIEEEFKLAESQYQTLRINAAEFAQARQKVIAAKAKLTELESGLTFAVGRPSPDGEWLRLIQGDATCLKCHQSLSREEWDEKAVLAAHKVLGFGADWIFAKKVTKGPLAEKIRAALDKEVRLNYSNADVDDVIKGLQELSGVPIQVVRSPGEQPGKLNVRLEGVSFGAALQWLEDVLPNARIVVREYGLLIAPRERIPPGAVLLNDFWKGTGKDKPKEGGDDKPMGMAEKGQVLAIDPKTGLVKLSIGSDDGLKQGQIVHAFRLSDKPSESKYLGTLRILEVKANQAVAEPPKGRGMAEPPRPGDRVAVQTTGN
jgi:hypothetical protein